MTRLVQIKHGNVRRVALVEEPHLRLLDGCDSVYDLSKAALATGVRLSELVRQRSSTNRLDYDPIYCGRSDWQLLPPVDHPEPACCLVSGTGLTHLGSARDRQSMHAGAGQEITDSMQMFRWGVEGGRPNAGEIGTAPEWFYKGTGTTLRAHGQPLEVPSYAEDGGEEAEVAGIYLIAPDGTPCRIGMAGGNEFSDHSFEKKNYLNLAGSKLRTCALGPELVVDPDFQSVQVDVNIERKGGMFWSTKFRTGEEEMCHSLQNMEHHHFKFATHRRPGDIHVHFFGTDCLSFGAGIHLEDGDVMQVAFESFGRPLRNPVQIENSAHGADSSEFVRVNRTMSKPRVAILGLGIMGGGMAGQLLSAGFPVSVYNRNRERAEPLSNAGAFVADSPRQAASRSDIVISMVADDAASRAIWLGEAGVLAGVTQGAVLIESSTLSVGWVKELAALATKRGCDLLDAPVTGTKPHAASGELFFMVGGAESALGKAQEVLSVLGREVLHLGPTGSGAFVKLVNNFVCGVQAASFAEALALVDASGLDRGKCISILANSALASPLIKRMLASIAADDFTPNFPLKLMTKDIGYAIVEAAAKGLTLQTAEPALDVFKHAVAEGLGDQDFSAVVKSLQQS